MGVGEFNYRVIGDPYLHVMKGSRDILLKFLDPSISRERFELDTCWPWGAQTMEIQK